LHHGNIAAGGGKGNNTKSLTTRSGSTVTLDDEKGSVTVSDPSGNVIILQGNGQILIHAPNAITFSSKDIHLHASNSLNLNAVPSKQGGEGTIALHAKKSISSMAEDEGISLSAKKNVDLLSTDANVSLQAKVKVAVNSDDQVLVAGKTTDVKGATVNVAGTEVNINEG